MTDLIPLHTAVPTWEREQYERAIRPLAASARHFRVFQRHVGHVLVVLAILVLVITLGQAILGYSHWYPVIVCAVWAGLFVFLRTENGATRIYEILYGPIPDVELPPVCSSIMSALRSGELPAFSGDDTTAVYVRKSDLRRLGLDR